MSRLHRSLAALGLVVACGDAEPSRPEAVAWFTSPTGIALEAARTQAVDLRWRPPTCPQVYRVTIDEDVPERHQRLTNTPPERSQSFLVLGPDHLHPQQVAARPGEDDLWQGLQVFFGPRTKDRTLRRELHLSGALLGPASPDAACFERTWDPMEDALALGWPRLPARLVARGETWTGARVESRCNKAACIDPQSGAGGADAHQLPCVTMSWREHLEGIYEREGERYAAISSYWSDGNPPGVGIYAERTALIASRGGRLVATEAVIHHGFLKITRNVRIEAVDACPGGMAASGWRPPADDDAALSRAIARGESALRKGD